MALRKAPRQAPASVNPEPTQVGVRIAAPAVLDLSMMKSSSRWTAAAHRKTRCLSRTQTTRVTRGADERLEDGRSASLMAATEIAGLNGLHRRARRDLESR